MVTPFSPSPYTPSRYSATLGWWRSSSCTAVRSAPVPLPWIMRTSDMLLSTHLSINRPRLPRASSTVWPRRSSSVFYIRVCPGGGAPQGALAGDRRFLLGRQQAQIRRFDPRFQHTGGNQNLTAQFQHVALANALDEHMVPLPARGGATYNPHPNRCSAGWGSQYRPTHPSDF